MQFLETKYLNTLRFISILLYIVVLTLLMPFQTAYAQESDDRHKWSFGFQAGVLSGNLPSVSATNAIVSRFNVENDFYLTAAFQAGYSISEFESLYLTLSRSEFSVFTDYEFWPDVLFENQFYSANFSAQFALRRFIDALPNRLDPYGSFGLGLMNSRHSVTPLNSQGTTQNDFSDGPSDNLSFIITTGLGFDYSLNSKISLFLQFNQNFLSSDLIDRNLAGEILQNDFIQTTNKWSTLTSGFRFKFGRAKQRIQPEPPRDDFQIVSTIHPDRLSEIEEEISDPVDQIDEYITESDSTAIQTVLTPKLPDAAVEVQPSEENTDSENRILQEDSVTEINDVSDDFENEITIVTQPRFGLMGTTVEEIPGSYSLNLHSFTELDAVNEVILRLDAEGYRVVTQMVTINGIDYLRVAVGQFENRNEARSTAGNLPESYRNNYFIIQI